MKAEGLRGIQAKSPASDLRPSDQTQAGVSLRRPCWSVLQAMSRTASTTWASVMVRAASTRVLHFQLR